MLSIRIVGGSNGRGPLEACALFPPDFTNVPFPDFVLYPFAVINPNCKNDCMLRPVQPLRESLSPGGHGDDVTLPLTIQTSLPPLSHSSPGHIDVLAVTHARQALLHVVFSLFEIFSHSYAPVWFPYLFHLKRWFSSP